MRSIAEALREVLCRCEPLEAERVGLLEARERFLAEEIRARGPLPPFTNSAMDGYAVGCADVQDTPEIAVVGESRAGQPFGRALPTGTAVRILTGAMVPEGADAVVPQEQTERTGNRVRLREPPTPGQHIRHAGSDCAAGEVMLPPGGRVTPGGIGLLASLGLTTVSVHRRPLVAILSVGDELREPSDPADQGSIVDSNGQVLAAQVVEAGGVPWRLPILPDDLPRVTAGLRQALRADLVLSSGGASVGDYDFMPQAYRELGAEMVFWKVAIKPGKPIALGVAQRTPILALPGNPVSALVTFEVFGRPVVRRMIGDPAPHRSPYRVTLAESYRRKPGRTELARAVVERSAGQRIARLMARQGSGALTSTARATALVILPADRAQFAAGEELDALPLGPPPGAADLDFSESGSPPQTGARA